MKNPLHILVPTEEVPLKAIHQFYVDVEKEEYKLDTICDIYEVCNYTFALLILFLYRHSLLINPSFFVTQDVG